MKRILSGCLSAAVLSLAAWGFVAHAGAAESHAAAASGPGADQPLAIRPLSPQLQWGPCPAIFPKGCEIAVLHGDPAHPNADIFLRVPGGYRIPAHTHSSVERMVLVTGQLNVQYRGAKMAPLTVGQYAFGPAKLPHKAVCVSKKPCTLFIA